MNIPSKPLYQSAIFHFKDTQFSFTKEQQPQNLLLYIFHTEQNTINVNNIIN